MNHDDIWKEKLELDKARRYKLNEFLSEYDAQIYDPAIKRLRENCEKLGHKFSFHGFDISYNEIYKCDYCGFSKHEEK